jgi:hypothetical protein
MEGEEILYVWVRNLVTMEAKAVKSCDVFRWIDNERHEPFDHQNFSKGNNFIMYVDGKAVPHAAFAYDGKFTNALNLIMQLAIA